MRSFNAEIRGATPVPPPGRPVVPAPDTESAAGEEDPGSALDTQPEMLDDDEDPDLAFMDEDLALPPREAAEGAADGVFEDESADPVGDGHSDAELAATQPPAPPRPDAARKPPGNPQPARSDDAEVPQEDQGDAESHQPGRD